MTKKYKKCLPAVNDGDNSGTVFSDMEEHRHGEVEMRARRVTPTAVVVRQSIVRGTEVSSSNEDGRTSGMAPLWVIVTLDLKTRSTTQSIVE